MVEFKGPDVSEHNGKADWDKAKADGAKFAMIRMGFGGDIESQDDEQFEQNVKECERLGIPWGAYLYSYALNVEDAKSEVKHALRLLKGKNPTYPIGFDMEDADHYKAKHGNPSDKVLRDICNEFLSSMEEEGYYVILYASLNWLENRLNDSKLDKFDKWVAQWGSKCTYNKPYGMWQYGDSEKLDGIGNVDMNISYRDYPSLIKGASKPEPKPKTVDELAHEVIDGKYGAGEARKKALGDRYDEVQARVNELTKPEPKPKTVDELAHDVINGKLGVGEARKKALGSRYDEVQKRVNELTKPKPKPKTTDQLAREVIEGNLGYGEVRKKALGDRYDEVQARVNELMGGPKEHHSKSISQLADEVIAGKLGSGRDRMRALGNKYAQVQAEVNRRMNG